MHQPLTTSHRTSCWQSLLALAVILLLAIFGCKKEQTTEPLPPAPDTTSHNFSWQLELLGNGAGSGVFYDVAILNDTLAYAVGEFYMKDSLGRDDPNRYNAAVWNGHTWTVRRLSVSYHGYLSAWPLSGVFAFSPTDIWLAAGVPIHGDGRSWTLYHLYDMGVLSQTDGDASRIWGASPSDLYFVGLKGCLVHYNGHSWQKLETGTTVPIQDIWGAVDARSGAQEILAVASRSLGLPSEKKLLSISGTTVNSVSDSGLLPMLTSVWFASPGAEHYIVGASLYKKADLSGSTPWIDFRGDLTSYYTFGVRGQSANDVVIVGSYGEVLHYNGETWRSFRNVTALSSGNLYAVAIKSNLAIAVGSNEGRAAVLVGRRY